MDFSLVVLILGASMALTTFMLNRKPTLISEGIVRVVKRRMGVMEPREAKDVKVVDVYDPVCFLQTPPPISFDELVKYEHVRGIIVLLEEIPWSAALRDLESKILAYKVMLERNPSSKKIEKKLRTLEHIYSSIVSRGNAFRTRILLVTRRNEAEAVKSLLKSIESSGCRARLTSLRDILDLVAKGSKLGVLADSSQVEFILEPVVSRARMIDYSGIYVGRELSTGMPVHVSLWERGARHVLILGPTGRGKTTLLSTLIRRLSALEEGVSIIAVDPKGDLVELLASTVECECVHVERRMLSLLIAAALSQGAQLSALMSSGAELSSREVALLDSLEVCSQSVKDMYAKSLAVKLSALGIDASTLCSSLLEEKSRSESLSAVLENIVKGVKVFDLTRLSDGGRNVALAAILSIVIGYLERLGPAQKLRIVLALDEAWRLKSVPSSLLSRLFREGRSYGVSVVMAVQDPDEVPETAWNNASVVFAFGSHDKGYVEKVSRVLRLDASDRDRMQWLKRGEVLLRYQWDPRPLFVVVDTG